jgi:anaerobic magnesium-protoporphyrin IX monomethyl ester cyclase
MKVFLIGPELEENLGLRYMASALEAKDHDVEIVPFNFAIEIPYVVDKVSDHNPEIIGLSMSYANRAKEFCKLAQAFRENDFQGHIIAGGPFASFNSYNLLRDFLAFDSIALGEGEDLICNLADNLSNLSNVPGLYYRMPNGLVVANLYKATSDDLDALQFPKRTTFPRLFEKAMANVLTSRGCWRDCAFCSIHAWYDRMGGKKFRVRSIENVVKELKYLYFEKGARIIDFQDDNFYLPDPDMALQRFEALRDALQQEGIEKMGILIKARPDSISRDSVTVLNEIGLLRIFLGIENASKNGLRNLNRGSTVEQAINALDILNDFDIGVVYNLLIFEPNTVMEDLLKNLQFMERHIDSPFSFGRVEVFAKTKLEEKLYAEGRLLGDYFTQNYRIEDANVEIFHYIASYAFINRDYNGFGLARLNVRLDFLFQILQYFHPETISMGMRAATRNLIKRTNLDTYQHLCDIYDFVESIDSKDRTTINEFRREMRRKVDVASTDLYKRGMFIQSLFKKAYGGISKEQ